MPIITLTTDFGLRDHYVGVMKGVILGVAPSAAVVDITHEVEPQSLRHAAVVVADAVPYFPAGTIHVVVVDPGVGTGRRVLLVETGGQWALAPDNGVLTPLLSAAPPERVIAVTNKRYYRPAVSRTFHGRDIFAPVAAHLAAGVAASEFGSETDTWETLDWPQPHKTDDGVAGQVLYADRFGNLITNITGEAVLGMGEGVSVRAGGRECPLVGVYGDAAEGNLVALIDSSGRLEISVVNGSARDALGVGPDAPVAAVRGG